jgi:hypothetical protein
MGTSGTLAPARLLASFEKMFTSFEKMFISLKSLLVSDKSSKVRKLIVQSWFRGIRDQGRSEHAS